MSADLVIDPPGAAAASAARHPFLASLGAAVRARRSERGLTRRALAAAARISERHLASLEQGSGNVSMLVLLQVASALDCAPQELLGHGPASGGRRARLQARIAHCDARVLGALEEALGAALGPAAGTRALPVALVGLRGAGKSTLGQRLALDLDCPFVELTREIEQQAGCPVAEILGLYGQEAYARYALRALEHTLGRAGRMVIATPGGLVAQAPAYALLLDRCLTLWLQADPAHHMGRVVAQGDLRPMAASVEAMADLRAILAAREPAYARADLRLDTSRQDLDATFERLRALVRPALGLAPAGP